MQTKGELERERSWLCVPWAGLFLGLLEAARIGIMYDYVPVSTLGRVPYYTGFLVISVLAVTANFAPLAVIHHLLTRYARFPRYLWFVLAGVFGLFWQDTIMHGDGIRAHPWYDSIRIVGAVVAPMGLMAFTRLVLMEGVLSRRVRVWLTAAVLVVAVAVNMAVLTDYTAFHGFLAAFEAGLFLWLAWPYLGHFWARRGAIAMPIIGLLLVAVMPKWDAVQRHVQRYTHIPSTFMAAMPVSRPFVASSSYLIDRKAALTASEEAKVRAELDETVKGISEERRGKNVLFVVLESTRSDDWSNPDVTPRFHQWRKRGLYVPRAVAQYPATPLAYGAMFTSQSPSVLTGTPMWARNRLFDALRDEFDHLFLSRPDVSWFEHSAITAFFVPEDVEVQRHGTAQEGLARLRRSLSRLDRDASFFSWVHLYEPHAPYDRRRAYMKGKGWHNVYRSEVRYVDAELGKFMRWFFRQPFARETLVVVMSDHGEGMGDKVMGRKYWGHHVHVHSVVSHIPAFFAGPGLPTGVVDEELAVAQLDVMPTIFDFLGVPLPENAYVQGRSLYDLVERRPRRELPTEAMSIRGKEFFDFIERVREKDPDVAKNAFAAVTDADRYALKVSIQSGRWKLVYDRLLGRSWLFDLETDPEEKRDASEVKPEVLREMKQRMANWERRQVWITRQFDESASPDSAAKKP